jgi:hypothetical protein
MNPVIVTGMHRSGTSAVARLVQQSGFNVGTNLLAATEGNIYGHFEEASFIRFHDALIARLFPKRAPFCEWLPLADSTGLYTDAERAEAKSLWQTHRASGGNSWKDPRTSLFLDLWTETLPDAKFIICLRHPYEVHRSLLRRGEPFLHVDYSSAIAGWTVYNQRILRLLATLPRNRFTVIDVDTAFKEPHALSEALAHFTGTAAVPGASDAIALEAFHFEEDLQTALAAFENFFPGAGALYRQMKQLDLLHPVTLPAASPEDRSPIRSDEARLVEFEETHGLRAKARKMLIRSIAVDRQRSLDLYQQAMKASEEKDGLIDDLSRFNEQLKQKIIALARPTPALELSHV